MPPAASDQHLPETIHYGRLAAAVAVGVVIWLLPRPAAVSPEGWRMLAIFASVIAGFLLQPMSMGPLVVTGLVAAIATHTLSTREALVGYGDPVVWLVVGAFILAGAVRDTGLGRRIALWLVVKLGRTTLGLGYAQVAAELLLGPVVPSNTARGGGILAPICASLATAMGSDPVREPERAGRFLTLVGAHANLITAAMFLTGMAANPLFARAAQDVYGIEYGWSDWALACSVPGLVSLALLPLVIHALEPPELTDARPARTRAREELAALGPWSRSEKIMAAVFVGMIALWTTKSLHGYDTAAVALMGVTVLLLSRAHSWSRMVADAATWDALMWLGGLLTLAGALRDLGVIAWFADAAGARVEGAGMLATVLGLALVYFYSMYGFSMLTAHISAMAAAFLALCAAAGVPAMLAIPLFGAFSNLCAATTNYSTGPVIIYFGLGYVPTRTWFRVGFAVSLFHLAVWIPVGLGWWKLLGWW